MSTERHIVAMGGGGFSQEEDNTLLDDFVLSLTGRDRPRVCFLPTASGDAEGYIERFRLAFPPDRAVASVFPLFSNPGVPDWRAFLLGQDVLYVGGGSTVNLLAVWRVHRIDRFVREAWEEGIVLAGISAGMNCWFESCVTDSLVGEASALPDGLGFLPGSACPHFDSEDQRRPVYTELVASGILPPGVAADDGAALHYVGTELREAVASRPTAGAYRIEAGGEEVPIPVRCLA
jgi:peptidase E